MIPIDPNRPDPAIIARAAAIIRAGRLVAFPTETVYGLGANAFDDAAVRRIFAAKGRPASDPVIVHVGGVADLDHVATVPAAARTLAEAFWPGPLTIVLRRGDMIPDSVAAAGPTVGVRAPAHPVAQALIAAAGVPIAAPSANRFAHTSATTAQHVRDDLGDRVDLILDAGPAAIGIESTVIAIDDGLRLLRPGAIGLDQIRALLPDLPISIGARHLSEAPGQAVTHYAPSAPMTLFDGPGAAGALIAAANGAAGQPGVLVPSDDAGRFAPHVLVEDLGPNLKSAANHLYAALRRLDDHGATTIFARTFAESGLADALNDRLRRAASGNIVKA